MEAKSGEGDRSRNVAPGFRCAQPGATLAEIWSLLAASRACPANTEFGIGSVQIAGRSRPRLVHPTTQAVCVCKVFGIPKYSSGTVPAIGAANNDVSAAKLCGNGRVPGPMNKDGPESDVMNGAGPGSDVMNEAGPGSDAMNEDGPGSDVMNGAGPGSDVMNEAGPGSDVMNEAGPGSDAMNEAGPGSDVMNLDPLPPKAGPGSEAAGASNMPWTTLGAMPSVVHSNPAAAIA